TGLRVPGAFTYASGGLAVGATLGLFGLALSRWEATPHSLHYTPNRWLVLAVMLVVTSRLLYGVWRAWHAWRAMLDHTSWLAASGIAGALAAGALVVGSSLTYYAGVWARLRKHRRRVLGPLRP